MEEKEKFWNRLKAAVLKDFRLENIECSKYQLIFVTAEEILLKPLKKKKNQSAAAFEPFHSSAPRVFLSEDYASGF